MVRQGHAGKALATAVIGTFVADTIAAFLLALFASSLADLALKFVWVFLYPIRDEAGTYAFGFHHRPDDGRVPVWPDDPGIAEGNWKR
jgi:hypothetical protein